jgi:microcystin-dependent protein
MPSQGGSDMRKHLLAAAVLAATCGSALAYDNGYYGEIRTFAGDFCPKGWSEARGQILQISQNHILFALLGNRYGGDAKTTFALPDLNPQKPEGSKDHRLALLTCIRIGKDSIFPSRD